MYGSYLLDKHHWPLVFECVRSMCTALESGRRKNCPCKQAKIIDSSESYIDNKDNYSNNDNNNNTNNDNNNDNYDNNDNNDNNNYNNDNNNNNKNNKNKNNFKNRCNCGVIPLFCKIRICEDGINPYKATETFCTGENHGNEHKHTHTQIQMNTFISEFKII